NNPTSNGVSNTPRICEAEAAATAAATLPLAMDTKAMDDCTVDGSAARNSTPVHSAGESRLGTSSDTPRPTSGNSTKVQARIKPCRRQWVIPATTDWRDSLAPWKKNSTTIDSVASQST